MIFEPGHECGEFNVAAGILCDGFFWNELEEASLNDDIVSYCHERFAGHRIYAFAHIIGSVFSWKDRHGISYIDDNEPLLSKRIICRRDGERLLSRSIYELSFSSLRAVLNAYMTYNNGGLFLVMTDREAIPPIAFERCAIADPSKWFIQGAPYGLRMEQVLEEFLEKGDTIITYCSVYGGNLLSFYYKDGRGQTRGT